MPTIRIQGTDLPYSESDTITFDEGLIGMPHLRRMVLVRESELDPFLWAASLDDPLVSFLVVDPSVLFTDYSPRLPSEAGSRLGLAVGENPIMLTTVLIASDIKESTANLRAPLVISGSSMRGIQTVLFDTSYRIDEPLPVALTAQQST